MIVRLKEELERTADCDWGFDNLSRIHLQSTCLTSTLKKQVQLVSYQFLTKEYLSIGFLKEDTERKAPHQLQPFQESPQTMWVDNWSFCHQGFSPPPNNPRCYPYHVFLVLKTCAEWWWVLWWWNFWVARWPVTCEIFNSMQLLWIELCRNMVKES